MDGETRWYSTAEAAEALGLTVDAARQRIYRFRRRGPGSVHVRRLAAGDDGGRARIQIDETLLAKWVADLATAASLAPVSTRSTAGLADTEAAGLAEQLRATQAELALTQERLQAAVTELALTREQLDAAAAQLTAREFEVAEHRQRVRDLGETLSQTIRDLTK